MVKVRCVQCGNIQDTFGKWFYSCNQCNHKQIIENSIYDNNQEEEKEENSSLPPNSQKKELRTATRKKEEGIGQALLQKEGEPPHSLLPSEEENLEIEEKKEEKVFFCPICKEKVEELKDCENCGTELIWLVTDEGKEKEILLTQKKK